MRRNILGYIVRYLEWHNILGYFAAATKYPSVKISCDTEVVIADGDQNISSPYVFNKIATSRGSTQKRGTHVSTVKQSTRVQTQHDAR